METEEIDICLYILRDIKDRSVQLFNLLPENQPLRLTLSTYIEILYNSINSLEEFKVCPF